MFKNLGKLKYKTKTQNVNIDLELIKDGVNFTEEFIILKKMIYYQFTIEYVIIIVEN